MKNTSDPATWTQGKLLREVYKLSSDNAELLEALERSTEVLEICYRDLKCTTHDSVLINKCKELLSKHSKPKE